MLNSSNRSAEGALLDYSGTSLHFFNLNDGISAFLENAVLLEKSDPLTKELYKRGMSLKELNSRIRCGTNQGFMTSLCGCGFNIVPMTWHCDNKTCPICSKRRSNRIRRKLRPFLEQYDRDPHSMEFLGLITFSPENFDSLEEGLKQIRKDFSKFKRLKYVKERIYGGFPIIEIKTKNKDGEYKGWNIHIHFIYFGRFIDNRIRGHCEDCSQNLIKQDRYTKRYYCANKNCNSFNVKVYGDSKVVKLYKKSSKKSVIIDVQRLNSYKGAINYVTKYISANKDDFYCIEQQAEYILYTKGKKMISAIGIFFNKKLVMEKCKCQYCHLTKHFFYDDIISQQILEMKEKIHPPPPKDDEELIIEYVKV